MHNSRYASDFRPGSSRLWAVLAHAGPLAAIFISGGALAFVAPLVVWLLRRGDDPFAAEHARTSLNFQLTLLAFGLVSAVLIFLTFGLMKIVLLPLFVVIAFLSVLLTSIGAIRAWRGYGHRYPFAIDFIS